MAYDISDAGWVTGTIFPDPGAPYFPKQTTFAYHPSIGFLDLGTIPGLHSGGAGINDLGQIAGTAWAGGQASFLYLPGTGFTLLGGLSDQEAGGAGRINASGTIAGTMQMADGSIRAYRYSLATGLQDLGTLGGARSDGYAINDAGWVVGRSQVADGSWHAFLYRDDLGMLDLGPGYASGINNLGIAAGISDGRPVIFRDGVVIPLDHSLGLSSYVTDINDHNVVIGGYFRAHPEGGGSFHPFLWSEESGLRELEALLPPEANWDLFMASAINNHNQIVGTGFYDGANWAFRLDPIPEPSTWALLAVGGGLIWLWRRGPGRRVP